MQYNNRQFGEAKDALTTSPYVEDAGSSAFVPPLPLNLIAENGDNFITEDGNNLIAEQLSS